MSKKILIVEDDVDLRLGCHLLLKANGYESLLAADGMTAVADALKHRPDLIILDLGLPGGDGFTVLSRLRANPSLGVIPVVVVSARDAHASKERALKAGARAYVQKPWNDPELLGIIGDLIGLPQAVAPAP